MASMLQYIALLLVYSGVLETVLAAEASGRQTCTASNADFVSPGQAVYTSSNVAGFNTMIPLLLCTKLTYMLTVWQIIVGGGTAGLALATRLSLGLPQHCILVLEAGPAAPTEQRINVPGMKGSTLGTSYDWNLTTVPQSNAVNRVFTAPRGKVLGGSSALNLMCWDRASRAEYDAWEALGNPGWNWKNMLRFMARAENSTVSAATDETYRPRGRSWWWPGRGTASGTAGPVQTVINRYSPAQQELFLPTVRGLLGLRDNPDSLAGDPLGAMWQPSSVRPADYSRSYSANSYLPIAGQNLVVLTNTQVAKINLKSSSSLARAPDVSHYSATGVTLANGTVLTATREVILSAGSLHSPGLLERSGIGQPAVLSAAKIPVAVSLAGVGENLQDHIRVQASYRLKPGYTSFDILKYNASYASEQLGLWTAGQPSRYDYTGSAFAFMNWRDVGGSDKGDEHAREYARASMLSKRDEAGNSAGSTTTLRRQLSFMSDRRVPQVEVLFSDGYTGAKGYPAVGAPLRGSGFFTLIAGVMHPFSRGSVHISPSSAVPVLDPRYLSVPYDLWAAVQAARLVRRIANSEPLRDAWVDEYEPGIDTVDDSDSNDDTQDQWEGYVRSTVNSIYHPVGTCAMLPRGNGGVVDSDLKVYGTDNVRVVDASIIPLLISAHIQTAVYGIAEAAAEKLIKQYQRHN
jgi:choline dehydrogenase-like flavoprotein